jgi:hypothetical protein
MPHRKLVRGPGALRGRVAAVALVASLTATPALAQLEPASAEDSAEAAPAGEEAASADAEPAAAPEPERVPTLEDAGEPPADLDRDASDARPVFLVTEIVVDDGIELDAEGARDALAARFGRFKDKLDVRNLTEVKSTLDQQGLTALLGGETTELDKLGEYVDVDRVVFGRIHKVGEVTEVSVRVFNVRETAMEIAMSRRIKAGAADSLVLTAVDGLADRLVAWSITTYADDGPSEKFAAAKKKTVKRRKKTEEPAAAASGSPWSFIGVGGGALAGLGLGTAVAGAALIVTNPTTDNTLATTVLMATGGAVFLGGMTAVVIDGIE